jgi:hypothetical protein
MMSRRLGIAAALAATMMLAGCVAAPALPPAATESEVRNFLTNQNVQWWLSMFPEEPVPQVQVVETLGYTAQSQAVNGCVAATGQPAIRNPADSSQPDFAIYERALWFCFQQYPVRTQDVIAQGYLSHEQLSYLYDYYVRRLVPCLVTLGFQVAGVPNRGQFIELSLGYPSWSPYDKLTPQPTDGRAWDSVVAQCPPPPFARFLAPPRYSPGIAP